MKGALTRAGAALALVALACQCSSAPPSAAPAARATLERDVSAVTTAVNSRNSSTAAAALAQLRSDLNRFESGGQVTAAYAASVLSQAAQVQTDLALITTTTTTTTTTTIPPKPGHDHGPGPGGPAGDQGGPGPGGGGGDH